MHPCVFTIVIFIHYVNDYVLNLILILFLIGTCILCNHRVHFVFNKGNNKITELQKRPHGPIYRPIHSLEENNHEIDIENNTIRKDLRVYGYTKTRSCIR